MAQNDWTPLGESLIEENVRRGATAGVASPNGGGTHVFGMRSVAAVAGVLGLRSVQANFAPTIGGKGGRITGAIRRAGLGANLGCAPFLFFCADSSNVAGTAYMLGLSDEAASHIQLRKGAIVDGMPAVALVDPDASPNVLMRSTNTFQADTWFHLRLDVIVQGTGDVILQVFRNDLTVNTVGSPTWAVVPGMEGPYSSQFNGFVDDALGINTGSEPIPAGYMGFAGRFETANRAVYFDHISCDRQL